MLLFGYYIVFSLIEHCVAMSLFLLWKMWPPPPPIAALSSPKQQTVKATTYMLHKSMVINTCQKLYPSKHFTGFLEVTIYWPTVSHNWNKHNCEKCQYMWYLFSLTATLPSKKRWVMKVALWLEIFNCNFSHYNWNWKYPDAQFIFISLN